MVSMGVQELILLDTEGQLCGHPALLSLASALACTPAPCRGISIEGSCQRALHTSITLLG